MANAGPAARGELLTLDVAELANLKALRGVSIPTAEQLLRRCQVRKLAEGEVLLTRGQQNHVMYMILAGKLGVHLDSETSEAVAYLESGDTVGELSVMDGSPASAFVVAAAPARLLAVDETAFWDLVHESHAFAVNLLRSLVQRLRANNTTVSTNIALQREYKRNAMIDGLTGLHNRRWLDESLPRVMDRSMRNDQALAVLMADVDHFKRVNDDHGHPAGDQVLVTVAQTLMANVRPTDLVARYGGEEFVVILPGTDEPGARLAAERLRGAVAAVAIIGPMGEHLPPVTISVGGVAMTREDTMQTLIASADSALYESKRTGRNRVTLEPPLPGSRVLGG